MWVLTFRALVAGLSPRRSGFILRYFHVRFMVDEVAVGQFYHLDLSSSAVSIIRKSSILIFFYKAILPEGLKDEA